MLLRLGRGLSPLRSAFGAVLNALVGRDGRRLAARGGATLAWR
ncbi:MAG TPA: hypothetical protein VD860_15830 [Azospirillum sp.]|nr:hypothetical protein [Azospirillum sp.]